MSDYEARQRQYLEAVAETPFHRPAERTGSVFDLIPMEPFYLLPRAEAGRGPATDAHSALLLSATLDWINARRDCADFALAALLRLLYRPASRGGDAPAITSEQRDAVERAARGFCYWYDQKGVDGRGIRGMCFHTENHQILFHACEVLAGQLFPGRVFEGTGQTGAWHAKHGAARTRQWMDQRARFGFSEWLSCYIEEDLLALLCLYDFAEDADLRRRARMLVDVLLFEIALHSHRGVLGGTHGRTYVEFLRTGRADPATAVSWLVFGVGKFPGHATLALTALATSAYRCPELVAAVAAEEPAPSLLCRERHGLDVADAPRYGLAHDSLDDAMFFWACQTARHPALRPTAFRVADIADDPWLKAFIEQADVPLNACRALIESGGAVFDGDVLNTALSEVNLVTYRTPDYLLSCAQDFRPGKPGYQQHVWQATLDADAAVYTNHPGTRDESGEHTHRPNFWAGNRWLPRAAQHENVLVCLHHLPPDDPLPFSHARFPRAAFDEVEQCGHWTFGRLSDGYLALYSQRPVHWESEVELRAEPGDNVWLCEMGAKSDYGGFAAFVDTVTAAPVVCDGLSVVYTSPSQGEVRFGWTGPLTVRGTSIPLRGYPRFDNPYCQAALGERVYTLRRGASHLTWDFS
jgi:hypothetical protein